jgi:hypothetical protein
MSKCIICGALKPAGWLMCDACHAAAKTACPRCGLTNPSDATSCSACNAPLIPSRPQGISSRTCDICGATVTPAHDRCTACVHRALRTAYQHQQRQPTQQWPQPSPRSNPNVCSCPSSPIGDIYCRRCSYTGAPLDQWSGGATELVCPKCGSHDWVTKKNRPKSVAVITLTVLSVLWLLWIVVAFLQSLSIAAGAR